MAGYKRQSPLKKYGRRTIVKLDVDEQKEAYKSNAKAAGSVGRAVGAVGTKIGDAVEAVGDKNSRGQLTNKQKKAAAKAKAKRDQRDQLSKLDTSLEDPKATVLPGVSEIKLHTPKPKTSPTPPPPPVSGKVHKPNTMVGGLNWEVNKSQTFDPRVVDRPLTENDAWGTTSAPGTYDTQQPAQQPVQSAGFFDWYNPQHGAGGGSIVNQAGKDSQAKSPINRISSEYTKSPFRRNPYGNSPFKRSPLKAKADELNISGQHVDQIQTLASPSYLGEEGAAADEGYNRAIEQHNYKQRVWAEKAKDVDDAYGKLSVEPTGVSSWDAAAQNMAKEWKDEFTNLYNTKDQYSYEEYASKISDIKSRAANYQNANANIQKIVEDYAERKDTISASTPADNIDILETLAKGGDGLTTKNVNGVPTLVGTTLGGQDVSVPISDIASGKNLWKVNEQYDVSGDISNIADDLGKFKQKMALNGGVTTSSIGWDQLYERASSKVDGILSNPQRAQAIAAEKFGIDYDEWQEMGSEAAMAHVKNGLMGEIQTQFQPYQQVVQQSAGTRTAQEQSLHEDKLAAQNELLKNPKQTVTEQNTAAILENLNSIKTFDSQSILGAFQGHPKLRNAVEWKGQTWIQTPSHPKGVAVPSDPKEAKKFLARQLGVKESALKRKSPLRRFADFITGK